MAVPGVVIGVIKRVILRGAFQAAEKAVLSNKALKALQNLSSVDAILLNRAKAVPSKAINEFLAKRLGLPIPEVRKILNSFKQTAKMVQYSKGIPFRGAIQSVLRNEFGLKPNATIRDLYRLINQEIGAVDIETAQQEKNNRWVRGILVQIQNDLEDKIEGVNEFQQTNNFTFDIPSLFDENETYTEDNFRALEIIDNEIDRDIEQYSEGDGDGLDIVFNDFESDYYVYSKSVIDAYINDIIESVKAALVTEVSEDE